MPDTLPDGFERVQAAGPGKGNHDNCDDYDPHFLAGIVNLLEKASSSDQLQELISQPNIIISARRIVRMFGLSDQKKSLPREFLCAFLMDKYSENLFGLEPTKEEEQLIRCAKLFLEDYKKFTLKEEHKDSARKSFLNYQSKFSEWQKLDKPQLINSLIERYVDLELSRASSGLNDEDKIRWEKNIEEMQQQIRHRLSRIGGDKVMEQLEEATKIAKTRNDPTKAISLSIPTMNVVPIAVIIHELCFNRYFDLINVILQYGTIPEPQLIQVGTEQDIIQFMDYLRENLLSIIPRGTRHELSAHLEPKDVEQQVREKKFSIERAVTMAIDVMANSCAPIRDDDICSLKNLVEKKEKIEIILGHLVHMIELMRLDFVAYELIQSRPIILESLVQYEKKYFSRIEYKKAREILRKYSDWTEWLFLEEVEEMESMTLDKKRLQIWRNVLTDIIISTARQIIEKHSDSSKVKLELEAGVPLVLKQRIQAAIKEAVISGVVRKREQIQKDGFTIPGHSLLLCELITEIAHFFRLHLAIHNSRYDK